MDIKKKPDQDLAAQVFVPIDDSDYDYMREMLKKLN